MKQTARSRTYRFIVVYRIEEREIDGAEEIRRGWVERVPDPRNATDAETTRVGFHDLGSLPGLIDKIVETAEAETPPKANGRTLE